MATTNDVNFKITVDSSQAQQQTVNVQKRIRELMKLMTDLQLQGKANSVEYTNAAKELGRLKDAISDTRAQARIMSDDFFNLRAGMVALSLGTNVFSALTQSAALFGKENEELTKILGKLQAVTNLANAAMNIAKQLNKDSALMPALRVNATKELNTELSKEVVATEGAATATTTLTSAETTATTASTRLTTSLKGVGAAIKSIPVVGWIAAAVTALLALKSKLDDAREEQRKAYEETANKYKEAQDKVNSTAAQTITKFELLSKKYSDLGDNVKAKTEFIKNNKSAFDELGLSVNSVKDAENALIENKDAFIAAEMQKAKAVAAREMATELMKQRLEAKQTLEEAQRLASTMEGIYASQGLSQEQISSQMAGYNNSIKEQEENIAQLDAQINKLFEDIEIEGTKTTTTTTNNVKEVKEVIEDLDAEMARLYSYIPNKTEKQKNDEFWNGLIDPIDEYDDRLNQIMEEDEAYLRHLEEMSQREVQIRQAKWDIAAQGIAAFNDLVSAAYEDELSMAEGNEKEQQNIRKKYAKIQFIGQIASIAASAAKSIMEAWEAYGAIPFAGPALAGAQTAVILGVSAAQTIAAKTAMNKALSGYAAKGAFVTGRSHAQGGELYELEGGEAVLSKKAMDVPAFRSLASAMNEAVGGVAYPNAGNVSLQATVSEDTIRRIVQETVAGVSAIPVVVTEHDITLAQRNVSVTNYRSRF
jgi:hypothetical protein